MFRLKAVRLVEQIMHDYRKLMAFEPVDEVKTEKVPGVFLQSNNLSNSVQLRENQW